ncbi:MAG: c-type cytochrome [Tepidisphaeraceae bacterium]
MYLRCRDILALSIALLVGCEREERPLEVDASKTQVARHVELSTIVPGLAPSTQPASIVEQRPSNQEYEKNAYLLSEGQQLFIAMNCNTCHADGGGDIGPPLIDDQWTYGSEPAQVYSSIVQGRPNGMPAYGRRITEHQAWQLTAYVRSMSGQVPQTAAPGRPDDMKTKPPENTIDPVKPIDSAPGNPGEVSR